MSWTGVGARALAGLVAGGLVVSVLTPLAASAASAAEFDPGNIITDSVFYDGDGLSVAEIQDVLDDEGASCTSTSSADCLKSIRVTISASSADSYCDAIAAQSNASAAEVFATVGAACDINPAVLLVLVEKEQSLVSRSTPSEVAYRYATGFNCPDTAPCSDATSGFFRQVYFAARQFQVYRLNPTSFNHRAGQTVAIGYHPNSACGSASVTIANNATAGLYNYTPYQPNSAALLNLYGTGDSCSSYGNRNFWRIFSDWFGLGNLVSAGSFEKSVSDWRFGTSGVNRALTGPTTSAQEGEYFLAANVSAAGKSVYQDISATPKAGEVYTASIWLRSGRSGETFSGKVVLWALGGSAESASSSFEVSNEWTEIVVPLVVDKSGHSKLRLQVYFAETGLDLHLDNASVVRTPWQPSRGDAEISSPSFEEGLGAWTFKNGFMNRVVYNIPELAFSGDRFLASNTQVRGRSVGLDVGDIVPRAGETYSALFWVRSGSASREFEGKAAVWALGGSSEVAVTSFTVSGEWTPVLVTLPVEKDGHTSLRLEVYLASTSYDLRIDDVTVTASIVPDGSFDDGWGDWRVSAAAGQQLVSDGFGETGYGSIDGSTVAAFTPSSNGESMSVSIPRSVAAGETFTASLWLRTSVADTVFRGRLALWLLGGSTEVATHDIEITDEWTRVEVEVTAGSAHSDVKLQMYASAPDVEVLVDAVTIK